MKESLQEPELCRWILFKEQKLIDDPLLEHKVRQLAVISYKQGKHEKPLYNASVYVDDSGPDFIICLVMLSVVQSFANHFSCF